MYVQLDTDWNRLRRDPDALRRAATWQLCPGPVTSLDDVLVAVGYERPADATTEANLRRLVELAADDTVAAAVVVRRLLPGLLRVAGRRRRGGCDEAVCELLGALWIAVRTFDPRRRPACLAAALIDDADYRAFRSVWRRRGPELLEQSFDDTAAAEPAREPADELAELFDLAARAGTPAADLDLLRRLIAEPSPRRVALDLHVNEKTVRNRRDRITARLRELARAAA